MTNTPRNTQLLRRLGTAAVIATLALSSGCFTSEGGRVGEMVSSKIDPETGAVVSALIEAGVLVDLQGDTLVFDFSGVAEPGVLSTLDAGYAVDAADHGALLGFGVDPELSEADPAGIVLQRDRHGLLVSFDDLAYDQNTFIKVDLHFAS